MIRAPNKEMTQIITIGILAYFCGFLLLTTWKLNVHKLKDS